MKHMVTVRISNTFLDYLLAIHPSNLVQIALVYGMALNCLQKMKYRLIYVQLEFFVF